jgi:hypothetical protein
MKVDFPYRIKLDENELLIGANVGVARYWQSVVVQKRNSTHGEKSGDAWQRGILGAQGEQAVAKLFNLYWGVGKMFEPDVGEYHVRTVPKTERLRRLIIHSNDPNDPDDGIFFLVTADISVFTVEGWIYGHEGKKRRFWDEPREEGGAYFVPQDELKLHFDTERLP